MSVPTPTARKYTILRVLRTVWGSRPSCQACAEGIGVVFENKAKGTTRGVARGRGH